jgi:2-amino-4-hydroxy-6-hydroxymethyldihydropteridine diphosphokinase
MDEYMKHSVYLLLGGNVGDVPMAFQDALAMLSGAGLQISQKSSLYQSEAWGEGVSGIFHNMVVEAFTSLDPLPLLEVINDIEQKLGRKRRTGVVEARPVDIDILLFDDEVVSLPQLIIPHPRLHLRNFVLIPLCEIVPDLRHPVIGKTMRELLHDSGDRLFVKKLGKNKHTRASINN